VRRRDCTYLELADRELLAHLDLHDGLEPPLPQKPTQPSGHDDRQLLAELLQRGQVEMVVVGVRDEDRVDATDGAVRDARRAAEMRDAVSQHRIRQQADAVEVEMDRRVPYVFDPRQARSVTRSL
jgi:hypothetical protein